MTTLLKNGNVVNVFTGEIEKKNVLIRDDKIVGVGDYTDADVIVDVQGKFICPSFIDGHIHIESTTLLPTELSKICVPHGTGAIVADPHEIANVCGSEGISFMMEASKNQPMKYYFTLSSCVPATSFDENGATLLADDLAPFYKNDHVLGLAEMMNYPGVINEDADVMEKLRQAQEFGKIINGHSPILSGKDLDKYIAAGVNDDHECSYFNEAVEKLKKGMWIMIREGTAARNLESLINLFEEPYNHRCLLVTDDKHPYDLLESGHIDAIIRKAVRLGKNAITGIRMATIQAAQCFGLKYVGAVAPGYIANILVLNELNSVDVNDVYFEGKLVCKDKKLLPFDAPKIEEDTLKYVCNSFHIKQLATNDFHIEPQNKKCRVIQIIPDSLLTNEIIEEIDFSKNNGIDIDKDIVKIAVCERHNMTGHIGLGFINGIGIKKGAIASSVSHDSHNLIIIGTSENDMTLAGNTIVEMGGGICAVENGNVLAKVALPIAGLMSDKDAETMADANLKVRDAVLTLGANKKIEPFMLMAFVSLSVIPNLKIMTKGLIDVNSQKIVPLFV